MLDKSMKFYKVICKCGHVGRKHYIPIQFGVIAENGKMAAAKARQYPRVKRNHKDAILGVIKIDREQFFELVDINNNDPYLHCKCKQDQNKTCDLTDRLCVDTYNQEVEYNKEDRWNRVQYKIRKHKILLKDIRFDVEDEYEYSY